MPRYRLTVEYDGRAFVGWQRQANGLAVQQVLEDALEKLSGAAADVTGAGRTDAGVHALGQVAHVDLDRGFPAETVQNALNFHVRPHPISILSASVAPPDFHARFSAVGRHYRYRILNRLAPPALDAGQVWHVIRPLDHDAMHEAARELVGRYDFTSFRAAACQARSPIKTLDRLDVMRQGEEILVYASARSFLHNQVRAMVGSLKQVGEGRWTHRQFVAARDALDRQAAGQNAPPEGLCLMRVDYP
jgi:tRNA pseudouridine38-40 synthase